MNREVLFSHKTDIWATPKDFFDKLDAEFHFNLDACANVDNHKCESYYTKEQDGLRQPWVGNVWCNPPYGREITQWVQKAVDAVATTANLVVMLLPARTDTKWFHEYVYGNAEIRFVKGRLKFGGAKASAPFPNIIVIFRSDRYGQTR